MPHAVSQVEVLVTPEELQELREHVADELRNYREEGARLKERQRELEEDLVGVKEDQRGLEARLTQLLLAGRAAGLRVDRMVLLAGISRNKSHRITRDKEPRNEELLRMRRKALDRDPGAGITQAVADELAPLWGNPHALREAWAATRMRYGPMPTSVQTREVVREIAPDVTGGMRDV
jgi:hypothetical protein